MQDRIHELNVSPYNQVGRAPLMEGAMVCHLVYPEVYYRLHPYIMSVCDQMDTYGYMMPNQEIFDVMTDTIYDDVCRMYPDMEQYANSLETSGSVDSAQYRRDPYYGRRFRRRGLFRDLIDILLLTELFGRRRRYFY